MRFANPIFLILLLIIPILVFDHFRRKKTSTLKYSDISLIKDIKPSFWAKYHHLIFWLRLFVIIIVIIVISRPQAGRSFEEITTEGIDIMLCLDISGSMQAEDFKPKNRCEAAKEVMKEFIKSRNNDLLGLIVFSSKSFTQCPLTIDYGILLNFLDKVHIGMIEDGTAIGMGLITCVNRLKNSKAKSKVVILLTDGVNNCGEIDPITAAEIAKTMNIRVYTIGVGREGGAPIPFEHPVFGKTYYRNPDGSLVLTELDEDALKQIANITDGKYFRATDEKKLAKIYHEIDEMEKTKIEVKEFTQYKELFHLFLIPALVLFCMEIILANTKFRKIP